jgi:hypothetical protein
MTSRQQKDQQYRKKWISIQNFLCNNTGYKFAGIARAGSRKQGDWTLNSDLDIRFAISRNPTRRQIYPDLVYKLKKGFLEAEIEIGSSYNVINMLLGELDFDLVLLTISEFEHQVKRDKLERIKLQNK